MRVIDRFDGEYRFLSNFWKSPVEYDGMLFESVEHAYQAAKTLDWDQREWVRSAPTPGKAKQYGRNVLLRPDWEEIKIGVMRGLLEQKFADAKLQAKLIATGNAELVEGNFWHDTFWGVCNGVGDNHLGKLLMEVRMKMLKEKLRSGLSPEEKLLRAIFGED